MFKLSVVDLGAPGMILELQGGREASHDEPCGLTANKPLIIIDS